MGLSYSDSVDTFNGKYFRLDDMGTSTGGVARDTSIPASLYTQIYSYSGSGSLFSFLITLEGNLIGADPFYIKLEIDGSICFELSTLDIATSTLWNLGGSLDEVGMGISLANNTFRFISPAEPLSFSSNLKISIKKVSGGTKRFRAGLVRLTREA